MKGETINKKERIENAIRGNKVDRIPWTTYNFFLPMGEDEIYLRNNGLGIAYNLDAFKILPNDTEIKEEIKFVFKDRKSIKIINRIYVSSYGEISTQHQFIIEKCLPDLGDYFIKNEHAMEQLLNSWVKEYPFKRDNDYKLLKYFYNDCKFNYDEQEYIRIDKLLGNDGIVMLKLGRSPFQKILYELMGFKRCYFEYYDNRKKFFSLYELLYKRQKEICINAANLPSTIFILPDNLTSECTPPYFFKNFCLEFYNEIAEIFHKKGKVLAVHMDGMLKSLVDLISKTDIDVVEAFTPYPMGDLSISEAKNKWPNKIIWINYPGTIISNNNLNFIKDYTINLLREISPGDKFLIGHTENFPLDNWGEKFNIIGKIIKKIGLYPIDLQ